MTVARAPADGFGAFRFTTDDCVAELKVDVDDRQKRRVITATRSRTARIARMLSCGWTARCEGR